MSREQKGTPQWLSSTGIKTTRLKFRTIKPSDAPSLIRLWTDEQVRKYLGGAISQAKAEQRAREYVGKKGYFCVTERDSGTILGFCLLDTFT
jgi:hypothetical protein